MATYTAETRWEGGFKGGKGVFSVGTNAVAGTVAPKVKEGKVTNPEELTAAAISSCFTIILSKVLEDAGRMFSRIDTTADLELDVSDGSFDITSITLRTACDVADVDEAEFRELAEKADAACPVSKALKGTEIKLETKLTARV